MSIRKFFFVAGILALGLSIWILSTHRTGFGWCFFATIICMRLAFPGYNREEQS